MSETKRLQALGIAPADILLPREGIDMRRWAAIACDQYSSEPDYWDRAFAFVGDSPSALKLIIPEAYLETPRGEAMQQSTIDEMDACLVAGVLREIPESFVYVERRTPHAECRRGLVAAFDLDKYDFAPGNPMPIRATEGTILARIPPRMAVRRRAALECPHVMILIDDPGRTVIEPLAQQKDAMERLYATELMAGAGGVSGWRVHGDERFAAIAGALEALAAINEGKDPPLATRPPINGGKGMLFAVGDGNHSLATAKACWEELKPGLTEAEREIHPARWALAELVNLHDQGLAFHPIHRVVFHADPVELVALLLWEMNKRGWKATMGAEPAGGQSIEYSCALDHGWINVAASACPLATGTLQQALDAVLPLVAGATVDYVHGAAAAVALGHREGNTAFLLQAMDKAELFPAVKRLGVLPRKAFSMGEADEKRFYLECRRIR